MNCLRQNEIERISELFLNLEKSKGDSQRFRLVVKMWLVETL